MCKKCKKCIMSIRNFFKKHKLVPRVIDELKETPCQTSNDNIILKNQLNINSICVLHNSVCELLGNDVYIVKYVQHIDDVITPKNTHSLIPVACYDIMYFRNVDIKTMQEIRLKIDCYNYHNNYYVCPLQKLLHTIDENITKSINNLR